MLTITGNGMDDMYRGLFDQVESTGVPYGPRGKACIEVRPANFTLMYPELGLYTGKSRRLNYRFFVVETLLYIAGIGGDMHSRMIVDANKNMAFALNPTTGNFDGAYGPPLVESLPEIEQLLRRDPWSRQAVASIWRPNLLGLTSPTKDLPCTCLLHFYMEKDKQGDPMLSMGVYMRSNDLNWGTPYDVAAFCTIQCMMANALGVPYGVYNHHAGSLHYYEHGNSDGERPPRIAEVKAEEWLDLPFAVPTGWDNVEASILDAFKVCNSIDVQRGMGKDWAELTTPDGLPAWADRCMDMVRWSWPVGKKTNTAATAA